MWLKSWRNLDNIIILVLSFMRWTGKSLCYLMSILENSKNFRHKRHLNSFIILHLQKVKLRIAVRRDKVNHKYLMEEIFIVNIVKLPHGKQQCLLGNLLFLIKLRSCLKHNFRICHKVLRFNRIIWWQKGTSTNQIIDFIILHKKDSYSNFTFLGHYS